MCQARSPPVTIYYQPFELLPVPVIIPLASLRFTTSHSAQLFSVLVAYTSNPCPSSFYSMGQLSFLRLSCWDVRLVSLSFGFQFLKELMQ